MKKKLFPVCRYIFLFFGIRLESDVFYGFDICAWVLDSFVYCRFSFFISLAALFHLSIFLLDFRNEKKTSSFSNSINDSLSIPSIWCSQWNGIQFQWIDDIKWKTSTDHRQNKAKQNEKEFLMRFKAFLKNTSHICVSIRLNWIGPFFVECAWIERSSSSYCCLLKK